MVWGTMIRDKTDKRDVTCVLIHHYSVQNNSSSFDQALKKVIPKVQKRIIQCVFLSYVKFCIGIILVYRINFLFKHQILDSNCLISYIH